MIRLIDADTYADEMRKRQDACLKWIIETKDIKEKNYTINDIALQSMATFSEAKLTLDKQPTVNHEDVVRCKDCKHHKHEDNGMVWCPNIVGSWVKEDWFCADGERR